MVFFIKDFHGDMLYIVIKIIDLTLVVHYYIRMLNHH